MDEYTNKTSIRNYSKTDQGYMFDAMRLILSGKMIRQIMYDKNDHGTHAASVLLQTVPDIDLFASIAT
jgi:hypothetical protein